MQVLVFPICRHFLGLLPKLLSYSVLYIVIQCENKARLMQDIKKSPFHCLVLNSVHKLIEDIILVHHSAVPHMA